MFWALQVLDIWTTNRALKCSNVVEANPLLPENPHLDRLVLHKLIFLAPSYAVWRTGAWNKDELQIANYIMSLVVANNGEIVLDVRDNC